MDRLQTLLPTSTLDQFIAVCEELIFLESARVPFEPSRQWAKQFPAAAGVYAVFEFGQLAYVGESGSLQGRMCDLFDTRNHTLRRSIGQERFSAADGFQIATSKRKFPLHIEDRLLEYMATSLSVRVLELRFARREVEEHLISKHRPLFNIKTKRV